MLTGDLLDPDYVRDFPNRLRKDMALDGYTLIEPGDGTYKSFTLGNFSPASFLARKGDVVHVPLIAAVTPRRGAFRKLVTDIQADGCDMAVIAPLGAMMEILQHWGYAPKRRLIAGDVTDVWYDARL